MYSGHECSKQIHLSLGLRWSLIGHVALVVIVVVKNIFFPEAIHPYTPTLRVDMVGLPDLTPQELRDINKNLPKPDESSKEDEKAKAEAEAEKKAKSEAEAETEAKEKEMALIKKKKEKARKKKDKAKRARNKKEREKKAKAKKEKELAAQRLKAIEKIKKHKKLREALNKIKGNRLSGGTSLDANAKEGTDVNYLDQVRDRLKENWFLPVWLSQQSLSAKVRIYIDASGRIIQMIFYQPSGNPQFDDQVKKAIKQSTPLPRPPAKDRNHLLTDGLAVGFPL